MPGVANSSNLFRFNARLDEHLADGSGCALPQRFHITLSPSGVRVLGGLLCQLDNRNFLAMQIKRARTFETVLPLSIPKRY